MPTINDFSVMLSYRSTYGEGALAASVLLKEIADAQCGTTQIANFRVVLRPARFQYNRDLARANEDLHRVRGLRAVLMDTGYVGGIRCLESR